MERIRNNGYEIIRSKEKEDALKRTRSIDLEEVAREIAWGYPLLIDHNTNLKYKHQLKFILNINGYPVVAPCILTKDTIFIKTAYHNRKYKYLII